MDPVYSIPYTEFCVAQRLVSLLSKKHGYSLFAPLSRQERGVDLVVMRRHRGRSKVATIQVKGSRTYSRKPVPAPRNKQPLQFDTWYRTFDLPKEADFFCLVALYPATDIYKKRELGSWWAPQILLFSRAEMQKLLLSARTVRGRPEHSFGFGFNNPNEAIQTRGDQRRRRRDFSQHILDTRIQVLEKFLS